MFNKAFFLLQKRKFQQALTTLRRKNWAKIAVVIATLSILSLLFFGIFLFSYSSFSFLGQYPDYNQPVIIYSLAATFILASLLILTSSVITSLGLLYQKEDNTLIFSLPLKTTTIFQSRLLDTLILSNWPLWIFALPFVMGYSLALEFNLIALLIFLISLTLLSFSVALLGTLISLLITRFWGRIKSRLMLGLLAVVIPLAALGLIGLLLPSQLAGNLDALTLDEIKNLLNHQLLLTNFSPTTWLVRLVYFWHTNQSLDYRSLGLLGGFSLGITSLVWLAGKKTYRQAVDKTAENHFIASPEDPVKMKNRPFPYWLRGKLGALTEKDYLVIFRSPSQLFQLGFLIFLELFYLLVVWRIPATRLEQIFPGWHQEGLFLINFLFLNYLTAVLAMRYFFPMVSLEGHSSWVIWSAPIKRMKIFWQKYVSSFPALLVWLELSTLALLKISGLQIFNHWLILLINALVALTMTTITLGIGAIKPNFWEKNPEKLSTSPGGILATAVCLVYISIVSAVLFSFERDSQLFSFLLVSAVSLAVILPILSQIPKSIYHYEV